MKKMIVLLVAAAMLVLSGCAKKETTYKLGSGSVTTASAADGTVTFNTVFATVLTDSDDKIVKVLIDTAQNKISYDAATGLVKDFDASATTKTKKELGDDYGMGSVATKGNWYVQIGELEAYAEGLTVEEFLATPVEDNVTTDADLAAKVSIKITDYLAAVKKAAANAVEVKGVKKIGSAAISTLSAKDGENSVQADVAFAGTAFDKDGNVLLTQIDDAQVTGTVNTDNTVTYAEKNPGPDFKTKKELGDAYGLAAQATKGEWDVQIAALEKVFVGKNPTDVKEDDADVTAAASIHTTTYIALVQKTAQSDYTVDVK